MRSEGEVARIWLFRPSGPAPLLLRTNTSSLFGGCFLAAATLLAAAGQATAGDSSLDIVPEGDVYLRLDDTTRLSLLVRVIKNLDEGSTVGQVGAHFDITLKPPLRRRLRGGDWERDRYFWISVGYRFLDDLDGGTGHTERRGIVEATTRVFLSRVMWLTNRVRVDARDVEDGFSTRFRYRLGIEREWVVAGVTVLPYAQGEIFYDTRFDSWHRQRYHAGAEIEMTQQLRVEPYYARQEDQRSSPAHLNRIGLVLKLHY